MSLDMTIEARDAVFASSEPDVDETIDAQRAEAARFWRQDVAMVAASSFGVLMSSTMAVLLFLR